MYAIIRTGGKQTKVSEGDVVDVELLHAEGKVEFTPLVVVDAKGKVFSGREKMKTAKVTANVVGTSAGEKIDIFKYKNKTGYRRRAGHRQKYTTIEVTKIKAPTTPKPAAAKADAASDEKPAAAAKPAAKKPAAKPAAKKPAAKPKTKES